MISQTPLKIFGYSYRIFCEIECGIVIAESKKTAIEIIIAHNKQNNINNDIDNYTLNEIPFKEGYYFIDSYIE